MDHIIRAMSSDGFVKAVAVVSTDLVERARNIHHTLHMGLQSVRHHVTTGSGHFVTVTKYPDPDVTQSRSSISFGVF